jgi:hypothetical protein
MLFASSDEFDCSGSRAARLGGTLQAANALVIAYNGLLADRDIHRTIDIAGSI